MPENLYATQGFQVPKSKHGFLDAFSVAEMEQKGSHVQINSIVSESDGRFWSINKAVRDAVQQVLAHAQKGLSLSMAR